MPYCGQSCCNRLLLGLFGKKQKDTASVTYISYAGDTRQVSVPIGDSVMEGATRAGIRQQYALRVWRRLPVCDCPLCRRSVSQSVESDPGRRGPDAHHYGFLSGGRETAVWAARYQSTELDGLIVRTPEAQQ